MIKKFFLIIKVLLRSKIVFKEPKKNKLVVFDKESSDQLKPIIKDKVYFLMRNRSHQINKIYLTFGLIKRFIKNYNGNLMTSYLVSLLEVIKPKVVLTFIDNSFKFSDLAKLLEKKIKFAAIQNADRLDVIEHNYLFEKKYHKFNLNNYLHIPFFFCFGQYEIDNYKKFKVKVKRFYKVGSLRLASALHYFKANKINYKNKKYDICYVGTTTYQAHFKKEKNNDIPESKYLKEGIIDAVKYIIKFCIKHKKNFVFIAKAKKNDASLKKQLDFYEKRLTKNEFNFLIKNKEKNKSKLYNSYLTMLRSKVSISITTSMLSENLSVGNKILSCNLTKMKVLNFPIKGICSINNCSFKDFEKRLLYILSLSSKKYFSKIEKKNDYLVYTNKKAPTIEVLKEQISKMLH